MLTKTTKKKVILKEEIFKNSPTMKKRNVSPYLENNF